MNQSKESCPSIPLCNILKATDDFDDRLVIGIGGFGKVYKGIIDEGASFVAIKRLNVESKQGAEEFWTEVKSLSEFQHTNLVVLIGYCVENQEMILVYEYIASGTLADHLYKTSGGESGRTISHLTWMQRLKICLDAATGLNYLHNGTGQGIIHRDVKSTNILLDERLVAKVSDFGLSKNILATHVSTNVKGTIGYLDPDYFFTNRLTKKSDVYSFGVVLLEVLCGRPPVDVKLEEEQISLILWAKMYIKKGKLDQIIDPSLNGETTPQSLKYFAKLANNCLHTQPKERPTMSEVVEILENALASHERKQRSQGTIAKAYQGIKIVPKGMNRWWVEGKGNDSNDDGGPSKHPFPENFSLAEIRAATENFNTKNLLRSLDNCSKLYKGFIAKGSPAVAIKRFELLLTKPSAENIHFQSLAPHPNIMSLIGFCREDRELIFVHDYMVNGTLRCCIRRTNTDPLPWKKRLEICIDVAQGLKYLHMNVKQQPISCCVKLSNVFLDDKWVAKVAAFERSIPIPAKIASDGEGMEGNFYEGTCDYLDPEYLQTFELTKESEVYAFGVILLEVMFSKMYRVRQNFGGLDFPNFRFTVNEVIDPYLVGQIAPECFRNYVILAQSCVDEGAIRRPSMDDVLRGLQSSLQMQKAWESSVKMGAMLRGLQSLSWPMSP